MHSIIPPSMKVLEQVPLSLYTSFYIGGPARYFFDCQTAEDIIDSLNFAIDKNVSMYILGKGSNTLVSDSGFTGCIIQPNLRGMKVTHEDESYLDLEVMSGEIWDNIVKYAVDNELWGIENLSHIPGSMGAFAVQNVGAYGQEASEVILSVKVLDTLDHQIKSLDKSQLAFSYRKSIFNSTHKNRYIILSTTIRLKKSAEPNLSYGDLANYFNDETKTPTLGNIREAVIVIRDKKFPYPDKPQQGNAGSFFRGPLLNEQGFEILTKSVARYFPGQLDRLLNMKDRLKVAQGYKTPAAFLIDICGLAGESVKGAQINPNQPAIILNKSGKASSSSVLKLYTMARDEVRDKTSVTLGMEPELLGFSPNQLEKFNIDLSQ